MHECNPSEGSARTHWTEGNGKGWKVLDDKRDRQKMIEQEKFCLIESNYSNNNNNNNGYF